MKMKIASGKKMIQEKTSNMDDQGKQLVVYIPLVNLSARFDILAELQEDQILDNENAAEKDALIKENRGEGDTESETEKIPVDDPKEQNQGNLAISEFSHDDSPILPPSNLEELRNKLHFNEAFSSVSGKIWVLCIAEWSVRLLGGSEQVIHLEVENQKIPRKVLVSGVYAKSTRQKRQYLWTELQDFSDQNIGQPWMLGEDYNVIRNLDEYRGS
ncbi:OLC1v1024642C1 [Oldenlandia corymbosa var. corymbosa]|uniref:OLC1v1024642C1 n=1 Tax=Oldenlandia corymbosa var. corymbosa TaxID=529605 RepID=A0AAV1C5A2_OLDCO|nr:OLC1v1024642C1 [Oldenlandia corymbosa var. corymbosa]